MADAAAAALSSCAASPSPLSRAVSSGPRGLEVAIHEVARQTPQRDQRGVLVLRCLGVLAVLLVVAATVDLRTLRLPNALTVPGIACKTPGGAFYAWPNVTEACRITGCQYVGGTPPPGIAGSPSAPSPPDAAATPPATAPRPSTRSAARPS